MHTLNLSNFDAVAFDVEGTLADTIPTHHAARLQAFGLHGFGHITREQHELGPTYGSSMPDIIGGILHAAGEIEKKGEFKDHPGVQDIMKSKAQLFEKLAAEGFTEMPGAIDFVRTVAAHFTGRMALVTSSPHRFVVPFLQRYGINNYFSDDLLISEDVVVTEGLHGKPSPDPYLLAKKRLHASRLLVFEDTVPGVEAAKKAGATVVALGFDKHNAALFKSGDILYPPDAFAAGYTEARQLLGIS